MSTTMIMRATRRAGLWRPLVAARTKRSSAPATLRFPAKLTYTSGGNLYWWEDVYLHVRRYPDAPHVNMERVVLEVPINNGFPLACPSTTSRKRQVRFSARHDIILLQEVISQNPFASKEPGRIWARVGEIITAALQEENFEVDARRCRERTMLLLDYYKKQDFPSLRRFGTERLYAQKEDLLYEVLELEAEKGLLASGEVIKYQNDEQTNRSIEEYNLPEPEKPIITIAQTPATEPKEEHVEMATLSAAPTAKRPCQCCCQTYSEILSFLEKRADAEQRLREEELSLRREELEIQRSKIALERERLGVERKERERRFELESQERQVILDLLKEKVLKG